MTDSVNRERRCAVDNGMTPVWLTKADTPVRETGRGCKKPFPGYVPSAKMSYRIMEGRRQRPEFGVEIWVLGGIVVLCMAVICLRLWWVPASMEDYYRIKFKGGSELTNRLSGVSC